MQRIKGFSIIELLVVMAIIGVLVAVGIPAYSKQINTAKRTDGKAMLMIVQSKMERYLFDHQTYPESLVMMDAYSADIVFSTEGFYEINIVASTSNCPISSCYVLRGVPKDYDLSTMAQEELLLNSNGMRSGAW